MTKHIDETQTATVGATPDLSNDDDGALPGPHLEAGATLGRGLDRLVAFGSLSKRSNAPGLRSGYVAGDAAIISAHC